MSTIRLRYVMRGPSPHRAQVEVARTSRNCRPVAGGSSPLRLGSVTRCCQQISPNRSLCQLGFVVLPLERRRCSRELRLTAGHPPKLPTVKRSVAFLNDANLLSVLVHTLLSTERYPRFANAVWPATEKRYW